MASALRAYSVTTALSEVSVIVFAESVATAKAEALGTDWLRDVDWIELQVKRQPKIDAYAPSFGRGALDFDTPEQVRLARSLGWYEITSGPEECCDRCGLCRWELLPESELDEQRICAGCRS